MKKSGLKNRQDHESVMSVSLLEDIYEDMRDDDYLDKLEDSLQEESSVDFEREYYNALLERCTEIQEVSEDRLITLAKQRANKIVTYLVKERGISATRILALPVKSSQSEGEKMVKVDMQIEVK
jgi:hypothetical protein